MQTVALADLRARRPALPENRVHAGSQDICPAGRGAPIGAGGRLKARLRSTFFDVAAVIAVLRKVVWIVPGFDVDTYLRPLRRLHERIERDGSFTAHATRFLIETRKR